MIEYTLQDKVGNRTSHSIQLALPDVRYADTAGCKYNTKQYYYHYYYIIIIIIVIIIIITTIDILFFLFLLLLCVAHRHILHTVTNDIQPQHKGHVPATGNQPFLPRGARPFFHWASLALSKTTAARCLSGASPKPWRHSGSGSAPQPDLEMERSAGRDRRERERVRCRPQQLVYMILYGFIQCHVFVVDCWWLGCSVKCHLTVACVEATAPTRRRLALYMHVPSKGCSKWGALA